MRRRVVVLDAWAVGGLRIARSGVVQDYFVLGDLDPGARALLALLAGWRLVVAVSVVR